jgi:PHP family Zn ribbon phosphoesterase
MKEQLTIKYFILICVKCYKKFKDASLNKTMESECPHCGEWNYSEVPVRDRNVI